LTQSFHNLIAIFIARQLIGEVHKQHFKSILPFNRKEFSSLAAGITLYRDFSTFLNVTELSDQFVKLFNFARLAATIIYIYRKSTPLEAVVQ